MRNIGLHVIAMTLAILFWAFVRVTHEGWGTKTYAQVTVSVPLIPQKNEPNLICYYLSHDTVNVTLRGEQAVVSSLAEAQVKASVDLSGMSAGSQYPEVIVLPPGGLEVVGVQPRSVNVKLSPSSTKLVPVKVVVSGKAGEGLTAGDPALDPKEVRLTGPDAMLQEVQSLQGKLVLDGQTRAFSVQVSDMDPVNTDGTTVQTRQYKLRVHPATVTVTIAIQSKSDSVGVPVSLENVRVIPSNGFIYRLEVEPEFVTLRVPKREKPPQVLKTQPVIFESLEAVESRQVDLKIPDGVEVLGNSSVRVRIIPKKAGESESLLTPSAPVTSELTPGPSVSPK